MTTVFKTKEPAWLQRTATAYGFGTISSRRASGRWSWTNDRPRTSSLPNRTTDPGDVRHPWLTTLPRGSGCRSWSATHLLLRGKPQPGRRGTRRPWVRASALAASGDSEVRPSSSGRGRKSTRPGASGVIELSLVEFLDRLADLVPPPRKHRRAQRAAATSGSSPSSPSQQRRPAGAGSLRTGGSQAGEGQDGFARIKQHLRQSCRPAARPPTGASSCSSMTTATRCKRRPTSCPRSTFTASGH